jgi:hypothetical protein
MSIFNDVPFEQEIRHRLAKPENRASVDAVLVLLLECELARLQSAHAAPGCNCGGVFECSKCKRVVGFCKGGDGDDLCSECWAKEHPKRNAAKGTVAQMAEDAWKEAAHEPDCHCNGAWKCKTCLRMVGDCKKGPDNIFGKCTDCAANHDTSKTEPAPPIRPSVRTEAEWLAWCRGQGGNVAEMLRTYDTSVPTLVSAIIAERDAALAAKPEPPAEVLTESAKKSLASIVSRVVESERDAAVAIVKDVCGSLGIECEHFHHDSLLHLRGRIATDLELARQYINALNHSTPGTVNVWKLMTDARTRERDDALDNLEHAKSSLATERQWHTEAVERATKAETERDAITEAHRETLLRLHEMTEQLAETTRENAEMKEASEQMGHLRSQFNECRFRCIEAVKAIDEATVNQS